MSLRTPPILFADRIGILFSLILSQPHKYFNKICFLCIILTMISPLKETLYFCNKKMPLSENSDTSFLFIRKIWRLLYQADVYHPLFIHNRIRNAEYILFFCQAYDIIHKEFSNLCFMWEFHAPIMYF